MKRFIIAALLVGAAGAASAQGRQEVIPGTGMTPQGLAALNALMEMGGLQPSFSGLLENYYKEQMMLRQQQQHDGMMCELKKLQRGR